MPEPHFASPIDIPPRVSVGHPSPSSVEFLIAGFAEILTRDRDPMVVPRTPANVERIEPVVVTALGASELREFSSEPPAPIEAGGAQLPSFNAKIGNKERKR